VLRPHLAVMPALSLPLGPAARATIRDGLTRLRVEVGKIVTTELLTGCTPATVIRLVVIVSVSELWRRVMYSHLIPDAHQFCD
jgi:hypothetical protein